MTSYNGIPYSNENKQAVVTCTNMDKSHKHNVHKNKADSIEYLYKVQKQEKHIYCFISQDRGYLWAE